MSQAKHWCFTLHDYTREEYEGISWGVYGGLQGEICPETSRTHLQGFVSFDSKKTLSWLKKHCHGKCHFEVMRGTLDQARAYCMKEESADVTAPYRQWGEKPVS